VEPSLTKSNSQLAGRFCIFSNRSRNNGKTCSSFRRGITTLNSGSLISKRTHYKKDSTRQFHSDSAQRYLHTRTLFLALEDHDCIWDAHRFGVDRRIHVFESSPGKLTVLLFCSNILPSILRHNVLGKKSLVREPTCFQGYEPPPFFQGAISEVDTMPSV